MHLRIPVPVTFNPHKHHFGFLMHQIDCWRKTDWAKVEKELQLIGGNLLDLYTGNLTVEKICMECINSFRNKNITTPDKLHEWLAPREFSKTELSDHSVWVIKEGIDRERFLHIHPAKNSPFSIRVRATTLKTVLALKIQRVEFSGNSQSNLSHVNQIRTKYLDLSPIKSLERGKGILRIWNFFNSP
jgi:hypothetical protein